jgi:hypothetical protein
VKEPPGRIVLYAELSHHYLGRIAVPSLRRVGWLDGSHDFATGELAEELLLELGELRSRSPGLRRIRGFFPCPLCGHIGLLRPDQGPELMNRLGCCEIWVSDARGGWYCAPDRILHYIRAHDYLPPAEFIAALAQRSLSDPLPEAERLFAWSVQQVHAALARGEPLPPGPDRWEWSG